MYITKIYKNTRPTRFLRNIKFSTLRYLFIREWTRILLSIELIGWNFYTFIRIMRISLWVRFRLCMTSIRSSRLIRIVFFVNFFNIITIRPHLFQLSYASFYLYSWAVWLITNIRCELLIILFSFSQLISFNLHNI